jgi:predicted site-specific integrase-resolvase
MNFDRMTSAKDLAKETGFPYRTILAACRSGELESYRPSKTANGTLYISEAAWKAYLDKIKTKVVIPGRVSSDNPQGKDRQLDEMALT